MPSVQSRAWCFTLNNFTSEDETRIQEYPADYIVYGHEVGESGTPHLQGYVYVAARTTLATLKKRFSSTAHFEPARGSAADNIAYCTKDNTNVFTKGKPPSQGRRNDIEAVVNEIQAGAVTVDELTLQDPMLYHQYGRTLSRVEDLVRRKKFRTEMTQGVWLYGPTGVGKSHRAFTGFNPDTHYVWKYDNGWQDGYVGQEIVIINEFRGQIPLHELLQLVDKWPFEVRRRNREPFPFLAKKVIVTSSLPPDQVYQNLGNDRIDQLLRRFDVQYLERREDTGEQIDI